MDLLEGSPGDYAPVLANVRAASLNCYTYEAEVCGIGGCGGRAGCWLAMGAQSCLWVQRGAQCAKGNGTTLLLLARVAPPAGQEVLAASSFVPNQGLNSTNLPSARPAIQGEAGLEERASLLQQQLSLGDPCTFRILHKNALTLVTDPAVEAEADESLDALLR